MRKYPEHSTLYEPEDTENIKGVVQIVHGMCEHQKRYAPLAKFLNDNGFVVVTSDLKGHGNNVKGENEYGFFDDNAVPTLVGDIHEITLTIKDHYPDVPYFLLAHSMGTLISTIYFRRYDNFLDGLFLSGMPGNNSSTGLAKFLIRTIQTSKGQYYRSPFINNLVNGSFEKPFKSEGQFAWLSNDAESNKKYMNDPKCGFVFTLNGFYTLMELVEGAYSGSWIKKNMRVPIRLMSGSDDPCMGSKNNFMKSVALFKKAGYTDVDYILFEGQRHEIFNDTEKEKAMDYLLSEINKAIEKKKEMETE